MNGPFELIGDDAPVCEDGVCELPAAVTQEGTESAPTVGEGEPPTSSRRTG